MVRGLQQCTLAQHCRLCRSCILVVPQSAAADVVHVLRPSCAVFVFACLLLVAEPALNELPHRQARVRHTVLVACCNAAGRLRAAPAGPLCIAGSGSG